MDNDALIKKLECLSKDIYIESDKNLLEEVVDYIDSMENDLSLFNNLDLNQFPIFYSLISLKTDKLMIEPQEEQENPEILKSLVKSYEFTNIEIQQEKKV